MMKVGSVVWAPVKSAPAAWRLLPLVVFSGATSFAAPPAPTANTGQATPTVIAPSAQPKLSAQTTNTASWSPPRMDIRGLAVPSGYEGAIATHIDDEGRVYGYAFNGAQYFSQTRRAVRWTSSGVVMKLGPDNATDGEAIGMMGDQLVYWARAKEGAVEKINGWIGVTAVPNFVPRGIQNAKVYGWKYSSTAFDSGSGYVWPANQNVSGLINSMNAGGVIAGTGRIPQHMYWFELSYGTTTDYSLVGRYGAFLDVDTNGVAVGFRSVIPNSAHGDIKAYRYKPGSIDEELGTFGGAESSANGVTVNGETIVGWAMEQGGSQKAFIHTHGRMFPIDSLVDYPPPTDLPPTPQMWLWTANAINKQGQICGVGYSQGKAIPFLLKPKATTGAVAVNTDALKIHVAGRVLPAAAIDRKAAIRSKK